MTGQILWGLFSFPPEKEEEESWNLFNIQMKETNWMYMSLCQLCYAPGHVTETAIKSLIW